MIGRITSNIYEAYQKGPFNAWGLTQIKKKGLRDMGGTLIAESAHRIAVGPETLALRIAKHCSNALALAKMLEKHPGVSKVHCPGLSGHPQNERANALFGGRFGGLLGVELADGIDCFDFLELFEDRVDGDPFWGHSQPGFTLRAYDLL